MKKPFLALAVLSTFAVAAQAQTNVTIGGIVQANVKNYQVGNSTRSTSNELRIDDDYTSRFWLTGTEDIGGGNSAIFYIQNRFNTDVNNIQGDGNGLANGDTWVGLKGGWGQATIGKHTMMAGEGVVTEYGANGIPAIPASMFATNSVLGFVGSQNLTHTRVANSILYRSPSFSGFSGSIGFGASGANGNEGNLACSGTGLTSIVSNATVTATATATCPTVATAGSTDYSNGHQLFLKGGYANGPIYVNLAYWKTQFEGRPVAVTAGNADQSQVRLSASYTLPGGFKIGAQYDRATLANVGRTATVAGVDRTRTAWEIPASYTFGPNTILASYTRAGDQSGVANSGSKMYVLGYDYAFSKRTNVGVYYSKLSNDAAATYQPYKTGTSSNGSTLLAGESASILAFGVKHTF
ncbi:porin [soil metagenome]